MSQYLVALLDKLLHCWKIFKASRGAVAVERSTNLDVLMNWFALKVQDVQLVCSWTEYFFWEVCTFQSCQGIWSG